jgi:hypothetical protein
MSSSRNVLACSANARVSPLPDWMSLIAFIADPFVRHLRKTRSRLRRFGRSGKRQTIFSLTVQAANGLPYCLSRNSHPSREQRVLWTTEVPPSVITLYRPL